MNNASLKEYSSVNGGDSSVCFGNEISNSDLDFTRAFNETANTFTESKGDLTFSKNFGNTILNSIADAIVVINSDMKIERVNRAALDLTGFNDEELIGQSIEFLSKNKRFFRKIIDRKLNKGNFVSGIETYCLKKDGNSFPISLSVTKIYDSTNDTNYIVCVAQDITKRKRLEAEAKVISEIMQGVTTTSNLGEFLKLVHHSIGKILYAENCFVALYEETSELLHMQFFIDKYDSVPPPVKVGRGLSAYVFRKGRPMLLTNDVIQSLIDKGEIESVGTDSPIWLGIPLRTPSGIIGVLVVQHYEDGNAYTERDLELLASVGDQIALAIERKKAEEALSKSEERFQLVTRATNDVVWDWDLITNDLWWNEGFQKLFGYSADEIGTDTKSWTSRIHPDDLDRVTIDIHKAIDTGQQYWSDEYRFRCRDGSYAFIVDRGYIVYDEQNTPVRMLGSMRDVTERKSLEEQLTYQALHDSLTKLANRVLFRNRVEHAMSKLVRENTCLAVLFLDLDNFKTINDSMGHAAGDTLLVSVAERLRICLRTSDTAARLGGDEFAILIEDANPADKVLVVAERLKEMFCEPFHIDGKEVFVGASIGIAFAKAGGEDTDGLFRNADTAMYKAKNQGKGHFAVFEKEMREALMKRVQLETDLRHGIEREEFTLHYQPIINLQSNRIMGMEALVRWIHPQRGLLPPNEFIPIAEETNLIVPLGKWVMEEACLQAKAWRDEFGSELFESISVNISNCQFQQKTLVEMVAAALSKSGLPPACLILEITESLMLNNTDATVKKLHELKELGVKLAIDDFGTGYSSLSYLQRFPLDILKIDKSFIDKINHSKEGAAVTHAIIMMSNTLQLKTVAEGIEYPEQIEALQKLGCGLGQGYHFARPLDKKAMNEFLCEKANTGKLHSEVY